MKRSEWNDSQLEELLRKMPHLVDKRSPQDIYQNVSSKIHLHEKTQKKVIYPVIASIVAVFIVLLIIPTVLSDLNVQNSSSSNQIAIMDKKSNRNIAKKDKKNKMKPFSAQSADKVISIRKSYLVYENQLKNAHLITMGFPAGDAANVIPLSILIPTKTQNSRMKELKNIISKVPLHDLGLVNSPLENATFEEQNGREIMMDVTNTTIGSGSGSEEDFKLTLQETFRWMGYEEVRFKRKDRKDFVLSNYGPIDHLAILQKAKKGFFLYKASKVDQIFLAPYSQSFTNFKEALNHMDEPQFHLLPSIPKGIKIASVSVNHDHVVVAFSKDSKITNKTDNLLMLYAIMLTARDFDYHFITFTGFKTDQIGDLKLNVEYKVPVAPNLIQLPDGE